MGAYSTDAARWTAVQDRDPAADGQFVYCVRTTKIFCRPICKARPARRANVSFRNTAHEAVKAGFRACKRCKPEQAGGMPDEEAVRKIRAFVEERAQSGSRRDMRLGSLRQMAEETGLSKWHFHRVFKRVFGMTPKEWVIQGNGWDSRQVTPSTTETDFNQYMESLDWNVFGMDDLSSGVTSTVSESNNGDANMFLELPHILYTIRRTSFGIMLLAYQGGKVCLVNQAFTESELMANLHDTFPVFLYRHSFFDSNELTVDATIREHSLAVVSLLEKPLGMRSQDQEGSANKNFDSMNRTSAQ